MTKKVILVLILQIFLFVNCNNKNSAVSQKVEFSNFQKISYDKSNNPLNDFATILNKSVVNYYNPLTGDNKFSVNSKGVLLGVTIYDLIDTTNNNSDVSNPLKLLNNHIYHFAPIEMPWSFSNIAFIENDEIVIFTALNCDGKDNSIDDVINFLKQKLKNNSKKSEILERVKNYRDFGFYNRIDNQSSVNCDYWSN